MSREAAMRNRSTGVFGFKTLRHSTHLWFGIWILLVLSAYRIATGMTEPFRAFLRNYCNLPIADMIVNVLFFWLLLLLWLAYRQWATAVFRERELEAIIGSISPDVLLVVDQERTIRMCNQTVTAMFGYAPDEVIGRKTDLLYSDRRASGRKRELFHYLEKVGFHIGGATGLRKDGNAFPLELITGTIRDQSGAVILARDISDRMKAEAALRESEQRFRLFMKHLPACVFIRDKDGRLAYVNEHFCSVLGVTADEITGKLDKDVLPPAIVGDFSDDGTSQAASGIVRRIQEVSLKGSPRVFEIYRFMLSGEDDQPLFAGICMDVTEQQRAEVERRRLEAQMLQTQKLESLGLLGGGIAHDFNNLLAGILGYADLALTDLPQGTPASNSVREVVSSAERAAELCNQLLAYSGQGRFVVEPASVSNIVADMRHLLDVSVSKKATLVYDLSDTVPTVECDATQLRQVVMNLVLNASEALEDNQGMVNISTGVVDLTREGLQETVLGGETQEGRFVTLSVRDTGCGMTEDTRMRMFDPFFSTKFTGRGLGMAAVLGIVRGHRGAIRVDTALGHGTTVTIYLPASSKPLPDHPGIATTKAPEWKGTGVALVVDDEDVVRTLAVHMLSRLGFTTLSVANGGEALKVVKEREGEIAVILLDMTMPVLSGMETFEKIRKLGYHIPIAFSSGYNKEDEILMMEDGDVSFVQKPYQLEMLRTRIKDLVSRQSSDNRRAKT
jgi:PAS domain S-box-containing protein